MGSFFDAHFWEISFAILAATLIPLAAWFWGRAKLAARKRRRCPFSGSWKNEFKTTYDGTRNAEIMKLKSFGPIVWGDSTCSWEQGGEVKKTEYKIFGFHRDKIFAASYRAYDPISSDRGVFLVILDIEGNEGNGMITGFEGGYEHLESNKCSWKRAMP